LNGSGAAVASGGASGTNTVTVATGKGANFRVGDSITGTGLASGTTVTEIVGDALTVSNNFSTQASGNYNPSTFGTTLNISGGPITFGGSGTMFFVLNRGNTGATNLVNFSSDVVFASGTTYLTGSIMQGAAAAADGVNFTGAFSGSGEVRGSATINNSSNSQSGIWKLDGNNYITIASNSMGTAQYRVSPGLSNCVLTFSDGGIFSVSNKVGDTGDIWGEVATTGAQQTAGLELRNNSTTVASFSDFEVGATAGNTYVSLNKSNGSFAATYKITDPDWAPNANLRTNNTTLEFANTSGVQTIGGAVVGERFSRSGVGGTTILTQTTNITNDIYHTGGKLLVNNPTSNVMALLIDTTSGNRLVTTTSTTGLVVGQAITATGIAGSTFITAITSPTQFIVSSKATATATGVSATFSANSGTGAGYLMLTAADGLAVLGGNGLIRPSNTDRRIVVSATANAKIAPGGDASGDTIGTLTFDGGSTTGALLTMGTSSEFNFDISGSGGTPDQLHFWNYVGATDFARNNNKINLTLNGTEAAGTYTVTLFKFFGDSGTTLTNSGISSGLTIGTVTGSAISGTPALDYSSTGEIKLTYTVTGGTYAAWLTTKFSAGELLDPTISGSSADPDADGMGNLLEFVVGTEPKTAEQGKGPAYTTPSGIPTITLEAKTTSLTQATVTGESGTDLITWPDSMTLDSSTAESPSSGFTTLVFKDLAPTGPKRFYHLKIVSLTP
jgi:hypothetical protein